MLEIGGISLLSDIAYLPLSAISSDINYELNIQIYTKFASLSNFIIK